MTPLELHSARIALGLTQHQAAKALGVSRSTWCAWEAGTARIPAAIELALATLRRTPVETITLHNIDAARRSRPLCQGHTGWPVHLVEDCPKLADIVPFTEDIRCSVCDLPWGQFLVSQHESCQDLMTDGSRRSSWPITYVTKGGRPVIVETEAIIYD